MPRQARIDAPGALHHIIVRGIERKKIFHDDKDRNAFLDRIGGILKENPTNRYGWAPVPHPSPPPPLSGTAPTTTGKERALSS